ncbi:MAG: hypothetical protein PHQ26_04550 [Bacteroidales bacterium]|nr:hypothetical protein [Bacteroidales bacterium]MDD4770730.1 hypothetical protein [Bacteroidales bacterium]
MEERNINEQESLEIIATMIEQTREKVIRQAGMPFLTWGYTTSVIALLIWYLIGTTGLHQWHYLWFGIPALGWPLSIATRRTQKKGYTTYVDRSVANIWLVFGTTVILCSVMAFFVVQMPILFLVLLLMSMGVMLTGLVIRFPVAIGFGLFGILASFAFLFIGSLHQILYFAVVFFLMMVVPGHILYHLTRMKHV